MMESSCEEGNANSMWQCMKQSVATLVDSNITGDVRRQVGELLLRNIDLLENHSSSSEHKNVDERVANAQKCLSELREQVYHAVNKIVSIAEKAICVNDKHNNFKNRVSLLEDKVRIMENVNYNFRKILKLENNFLRDLLQTDRETIRQLHRKLQNEEDSETSTSSQSSAKTVVVPKLDRLQIDKRAPEYIKLQKQTVNPVLMELVELLSSDFTKEDLVELFERVRKRAIKDS